MIVIAVHLARWNMTKTISKTSEELLLKFIPEEALPMVKKWLSEYPVQIRIVDERKTKAGDYRKAFAGKAPRITINVDPNPYRFLIVLVHELAHHICYFHYGNSINPHGREWKKSFFSLLVQLKNESVFPEEIGQALPDHFSGLRATAAGNPQIDKILKQMDNGGKTVTYLEDIKENTVFMLENGQTYKKIKKRRVRYLCQNLIDKRYYLISPVVQVYTLDEKEQMGIEQYY